MPHRVFGITGAHGSTTPGDGGEFRDVALFTPGDRLRRIDWKATARRAQVPGELYVRRSFSTADAIVVLVVDDRDEVGADVTRWAGAKGGVTTSTSLDLAREAASSLSAAYLAAGDRVGFRDLAGTARSVEPGGGTRHLERLQSTIATIAPTGEPVRSVRTPIVPASSLVVVLSTFLDEQAATMAITWASTGHRVVAVDVLPEPELQSATREEQTAFRLLMLERTDRLDGMTASGVEPDPLGLRRRRRRAGRPAPAPQPPAEDAVSGVGRLPAVRRDSPTSARPSPPLALTALTVVVGGLTSFLVIGVSGWLVVALLLVVGAASLPRGPFAAILSVLLAAALVVDGLDGYTGRFVILLAAVHLLLAVASLSAWLPLRARVQVALLRRPLVRYVVVQLIAQTVAFAVLTVVAPPADTSGPGLVWLAIVAAAAALALAVAILVPALLRPSR